MSFLVCRFKYEKCQMENQHRSLFKLSKEADRTLAFSFCFIVNMLDCELPVFGWACVRLDSRSPCRLLAGKTALFLSSKGQMELKWRFVPTVSFLCTYVLFSLFFPHGLYGQHQWTVVREHTDSLCLTGYNVTKI